MDTYKLKFTPVQQEVLRFLEVRAGERFTQRRIALALAISPTAVSKALPLLVKDEFVIVKKDDESKRLSIEFNGDSSRAVWRKRADNLLMISESGLAGHLIGTFPGATIVLFGSYSRGHDTMRSDIDIALIGVEEKEADLSRFERILKRPIHLSFFPAVAEIHRNLRANIYNGIVIEGSL